ncbi:MAG TPA: hypothetical protein VJI12_01005 [archaeon]|nr:hypothetical protein [archaeon]
MEDFGLAEACNGHSVMFLDTGAFVLPEPDSLFNRIDVNRVYSERDQMNYIRTVNILLENTFTVTPGVSIEVKGLADVTDDCKKIPNARKRLIDHARDLATNGRVINYDVNELRLLKDASLYFRFFTEKGPLSPVDYEILMSSIVSATYRGPTGVLTNDTGIVGSFESMTKFLRAGYIDHGMPAPRYPIDVYSILLSGKFSRQATYNPKSPSRRSRPRLEVKVGKPFL